MQVKIDTKFDIGEMVTMLSMQILPWERWQIFQIVEIETQTCPAGTQVHYNCRPMSPRDHRNMAATVGQVGKGYIQFNEIELAAIPLGVLKSLSRPSKLEQMERNLAQPVGAGESPDEASDDGGKVDAG